MEFPYLKTTFLIWRVERKKIEMRERALPLLVVIHPSTHTPHHPRYLLVFNMYCSYFREGSAYTHCLMNRFDLSTLLPFFSFFYLCLKSGHVALLAQTSAWARCVSIRVVSFVLSLSRICFLFRVFFSPQHRREGPSPGAFPGAFRNRSSSISKRNED